MRIVEDSVLFDDCRWAFLSAGTLCAQEPDLRTARMETSKICRVAHQEAHKSHHDRFSSRVQNPFAREN